MRITIVRSLHQKAVSEGLVEEAEIWEWLLAVLIRLDVDGMSSEESGIEDEGVIYRVKIMLWRSDLDRFLEFVDSQRQQEPDCFSTRGSKGVRRVREGRGHQFSERPPVKGLPRSFYRDDLFSGVDGDRRMVELGVTSEEFKWLRAAGEFEEDM